MHRNFEINRFSKFHEGVWLGISQNNFWLISYSLFRAYLFLCRVYRCPEFFVVATLVRLSFQFFTRAFCLSPNENQKEKMFCRFFLVGQSFE